MLRLQLNVRSYWHSGICTQKIEEECASSLGLAADPWLVDTWSDCYCLSC